LNSQWPRGDARLENGRIWVDPLPAGAPERDFDGYAYYDPWQHRGAIYRHLVRVTSERQALGFAQAWGPLGEPQRESDSMPDAASAITGYTGTALVPPMTAEAPASSVFGEPVTYLPPRGRLSRWQPKWPQPVAAYLNQARALQQVSRAVMALRLETPIKTRILRDAVERSGLVPHELPRSTDMPSRLPDELDRPWGSVRFINEYFRWAGTESRSFLEVDDAGKLSLAYEYRSLVAPAALGMLERAGLGRLRRCHYPECETLSTGNHCSRAHERSCPLKAEHRQKTAQPNR
jgi:hypothetical protein